MSSYDSLPTSNYNLHTPAIETSDHGASAHHQSLPSVQSYQLDPHQHDRQQPHIGEADGQIKDVQQLSGNAGGVEKLKWKGNRLRKACDSCSMRKVRCDESGPPCLACSALEIPCTFERPSRRRGPPNKHAEALKRRRLESPSTPAFSLPTSPNNVAATLASFSSHAVLSAESICPFPILELLIDDFFTYIHPLVPFPHEPSFRMALQHREDLNNPSFLALVAAMTGALVASFPRKPRMHLRHNQLEHLFPTSMSLIDRCQKIAVEARGPGYLDKELTIYDACVSYFLALIGGYTINYKQSRLYLGETLTILRVIGAHQTRNSPLSPLGSPVDFIRQEIGRRIFWTLFVGARSTQQAGASLFELIVVPPTPSEPYPPFPLEVDDQYIYVSHIEPQPEGEISQITGFNLNCKIYMTCSPLVTMEIAYGIDEIFDWNKQRRVLDDALRAVKVVLEDAPKEISLALDSQLGKFDEQGNNSRFRQAPNTSTDIVNDFQDESRRGLQYEIQKANIYASHLGTRSYLVEKYWNLYDAYLMKMVGRASSSELPINPTSPDITSSTKAYDTTEEYMSAERESIVKDLMSALKSISQVNMEPNGGSIILKIRQIASTLLDTPRNRKGPLALKAEEYLGHFLSVLMKLERVAPPGEADDANGGFRPREYRNAEDEEEDLRNWADLREFQAQFATSGGFLTEF